MKEASFDCLFTAILFCLFCVVASLAICTLTKPSGETPQATEVVVYHHHTEPQPVLQSPLFPYDLPRPREPAEPTFEPRQQEAIPEARDRRYGLIPRFQRPLVDPRAVLPERGPRPPRAAAFPVRRERLLTEMSHRERMAVMDWEEGQERYREEKEMNRYYARIYDENEAVRARQAAVLAEEKEAARQSQATQSGAEERPKTADEIRSTHATEDGKSSPTRIDEITTKTADTVGSTTAPQDGQTSSPTRIDETTAKTADTIGSNATPQDGQNERKDVELTIDPLKAPYRGGSEAMQGAQPISGNNTQPDALNGNGCNGSDVPAGSYTNAAVPTPIFTIAGVTTQLTE
jgi:hypothetical protein